MNKQHTRGVAVVAIQNKNTCGGEKGEWRRGSASCLVESGC